MEVKAKTRKPHLPYLPVPDEIKALKKTDMNAYKQFLRHRYYERHREEMIALQTKENARRRPQKYLQRVDIEMIKKTIQDIEIKKLKLILRKVFKNIFCSSIIDNVSANDIYFWTGELKKVKRV